MNAFKHMRSFQHLSLGTSWYLPVWSKLFIGGIILFLISAIFNAWQHIVLCLKGLSSLVMGKQEHSQRRVTNEVRNPKKSNSNVQIPTPTAEDRGNVNRIKMLYQTLDLTTGKAVTKSNDYQSGSHPEQ